MTTDNRAGSDPVADAAVADALGVASTAVRPTPATVPGAGRPAPAAPAATDSHTDDDLDDDVDESGADELGDAGKQALDRMKARLRDERRRRVAAESQARAAADADDQARERREHEQRLIAKANARILGAEIRAAAAGRFADPADAIAFLDLEQFDVDEDGQTDPDEIRAALDELLRRKPHLAAQGGKRTPQPDRSQGATGRDAPLSTAQQFASAMRDHL
jgi:hypothetical protein